MSRRKTAEDFRRHFEGAETLDVLLELAGTELTSLEVAKLFIAAKAAGKASGDVIPNLFDAEPRFDNPELARALFANLLGLFDDAERLLPEIVRGPRLPREKARKTLAPALFGAEGPTAEFLETARKHIGDDARARERLTHSFENRQDALLTWLDEQGLSDQAYGVLRHLLFELHAFLELGTGQGLRAVHPEALGGVHVLLPELGALAAYANASLAREEHKEPAGVPAAEQSAVRTWVEQSLAAFWQARQVRR